MSHPDTAMDKLSVELHDMAKAYAEKAETLSRDPYFREAVVKVSASAFVWALYHVFEGDDFAQGALNHELKVQSAAIDRAVSGSEVENPLQ